MNLKKELPLIGIVLLPFVYLAYIWNQLPAQVPMHYNIEGEIDRYGNKSELILIPIMTSLLIYLIFLAVPYIDPKKQIQKMGGKYDTLKFIITTFMSILALFIIYTAKNQTLTDPDYILLGCGVLFLILGNYFKTLKANYFIGIRTPWTLESESVWKATHKLAGKIWFLGGLLIILSCLILDGKTNFIVFMCITAIMVLVPVLYSYLLFRKQEA
ncbi:SdpI family protein [Allomuricauda sp.]|uniref:SdpI family protein n=1 Tax=Flagellimonas sp. TaxID=2058762 RepID=UPI001B2B6B81|nr:SdpI family protein [Allomuricauda sp.]MBO6532054.1 SdpI family protein [Allomuricauda sp.]MBO6587790.1 SdpI family protein [Allomuricauda sp.]MBO6617415.1 SdpI family protein [Allomuricauda sp.]MBO6643574.1 SdpI family protein [Allomuricauda sp.]MBO6745750.1 SdpI family protein [Allomuricauda sp.]